MICKFFTFSTVFPSSENIIRVRIANARNQARKASCVQTEGGQMNFVERENPINRQTIKKCAKSNDSVTWQKTCLNNNMSEIINY